MSVIDFLKRINILNLLQAVGMRLMRARFACLREKFSLIQMHKANRALMIMLRMWTVLVLQSQKYTPSFSKWDKMSAIVK